MSEPSSTAATIAGTLTMGTNSPPNPMKTISVNNFEANRLTLKSDQSDRLYVYDARGYQFVEYPLTGDYLKEKDHPCHHPKSKHEYTTGTHILFDAYDDGAENFFAFFEADCFDPPIKLIVADSFESAYDIYMDEFASIPDDSDVEEYERDKVFEYIKRVGSEIGFDPIQQTPKEYFDELLDTEKGSITDAISDDFGGDGVMTIAPNGARTPGGSPYRWGDGIMGFELKLVKAEFIPSP